MSKSSKRRQCPAAQREITSAECGEHRNSTHRCPADCQFNPFAPASYSQLLEMESRVDQLAFQALVSEPVRGEIVQRRFEKVGYKHHGFSNVVLWEIFHRKDDSDLSFAQRWEKRGFPELKNDLRTLFQAKMGMYMALLEFQTVIDSESMLCRDLFRPSHPPFLLFDRSMAKRACRFDVVLGQCYDLPHFTRFFGTAIPIPFMQTIEPTEVVREIVTHLGGPASGPAQQLWLLEHMNDFAEALWATTEARRKASLAAADLKHSKAIYKLAAPFAECRAALDAIPDVAPERLTREYADEGFSDARVWFASAGETRIRHNVGREALGTILLGQAFWRLETITEKRMQDLRQRFEAALGARVKLEAVRVDDLGKVAEDKDKIPSPLVPPTLLTNLPQLVFSTSRVSPVLAQKDPASLQDQFRRSTDDSFLNDSVPTLDGATPRAAAQDERLVGKLRVLLKQRINGTDRDNLSKGGRYDAAWLAAELGQHDLCTPPPPPRPLFDFSSSSTAVPELEDVEPSLPPAPPLPLHLEFETAAKRIEEAIAAFPDMLELMDQAAEAGFTWIEDIQEFLGDRVTDKEFGAISAALLDVWFAMVPVGFSGPEIRLDLVVARLERLSIGMREFDDPNSIPRYAKSEFQSEIGGIATFTFLEWCKKSKILKEKSAPKAIFLIIVIIAFIDEMHLALGGPALQLNR